MDAGDDPVRGPALPQGGLSPTRAAPPEVRGPRLARPGGRLHTRGVRRPAVLVSALLSVVLAGASAGARPRPEPPAARDPDGRNIWRRITDPHGDEVRVLVSKARLSMQRADDARLGEEEWAVEQRARFYRDAYNLSAHARKLAPENLEALAAFARAAEELGHVAEAIAALEQSAKLTGPDRASIEVVARLGAMYLRTGDAERAIRWLRLAQGPVSVLGNGLDRAHALIHLATALAARGDMLSALHAIESALPDRALGQLGQLGQLTHEATILVFALAVLHDRDEQRASAFEALDHLQVLHGDQYQAQVQVELVRMRFLPPEDLYYYRALLYESLDRYIEARAEWALYAAAGRPAYRARALDHIAAIDAQRRATSGPKPAQQIAPPRAIPRRLPGRP